MDNQNRSSDPNQANPNSQPQPTTGAPSWHQQDQNSNPTPINQNPYAQPLTQNPYQTPNQSQPNINVHVTPQPSMPCQSLQSMPQLPNQPAVNPNTPRPSIGPSSKTVQKIEDMFIFFYLVIAAVLMFRFVFSLIGASTQSEFVTVVYDISQPFMAPFTYMFGRTLEYGNYRFEFEVIVALIAYAAIFFGLAKLARIILH